MTNRKILQGRVTKRKKRLIIEIRKPEKGYLNVGCYYRGILPLAAFPNPLLPCQRQFCGHQPPQTSKPLPSNPRIILKDVRTRHRPVRAVALPELPIVANPVRRCQRIRVPLGPNLIRLFHELQNLQPQSLRRMSRDMTVHQPSSGVVGAEGNDGEVTYGDEHDVAAGRVVRVVDDFLAWAWKGGGEVDDGEVVAVEMHL